ncbi:MAG: hypothetical protein ACREMP_05485 [Candidatus Tyrphobacter sp.]
MNYFFSTGEPSGEMSAVLLARAIAERDSSARFEGIGSSRMRDAGFALWRDHTGWAAMGPLAALPRIPKLLLTMWLTALHIARSKPDLVVLVDFGVFNVRLVQTLRLRLHYTGEVLYLLPPAAWLDSERTARVVGVLTVAVSGFSHQAAFYRNNGLPVAYFGHPLLDEYRARDARPAPPADGGRVALLAGSRSGELRYHLPLLLRALAQLARCRPRIAATLAVSHPRFERTLHAAIARSGLDVELRSGVRHALADADAAWVASGTAVLECTLLGVPAIALYVVSPTVAWYGERMRRRIVGGRFITLPNLVTGEEVVAEYLQNDATPQRLAAAMDALLASPAVAVQSAHRVREALGPPGAMGRCADLAVELAAGAPA